MRTIEWTGQFKRDYKRESKGFYRETLDELLFPVIELLSQDLPLAHHYRDHPLTGQWSDFRDCHLKPDLVLIYQLAQNNILKLARLGSHSQLGL